MLHFLFPNLSDEQRGLLYDLYHEADLLRSHVLNKNEPSTFIEHFRVEYARTKEKIAESKIESLLTAAQIELLDSDFFAAK